MTPIKLDRVDTGDHAIAIIQGAIALLQAAGVDNETIAELLVVEAMNTDVRRVAEITHCFTRSENTANDLN